ncbi:MAG: phenylalanine--tRNA ligase subunit beta [Saprospiraceae bacterium]|nr:phenylalanine--tRNA ligase subunit beta [Saprospiraceae bacterium]
MNVSLNWLKDYIDIDQTPQKTSEILTDIGLEVEGDEEIESIKGGLEGIVVGHVKECDQHPNADKLSLTKVNVGREEDLQIVCGAPNVAIGQKVLVATIGTTLYSSEGEAWKIKKGKIRGETSEGMICAEDELGLGNDHNGIIVLPEEVEVGTLAKDYYKIENDILFEIGLTPNRSDATCHLGVAKDLAAALKINYGGDGRVRVPSVDDFKVHNNSLPIEVVIENTEACPRYAGVSIKGVTIKESPDWLKNKLNAIGVRPISNIVDITNFILHELGQPLHAFDLDKIAGQKVIVKTLPKDSKFASLDEVERKLSNEDLMICDGDSNGMCIGGVFGGNNSGVKDETKNIFLESAHFNAQWIRRTSTRHNLRTDAAKVFEKGSDPNISVYALKRAAMMIVELAGGEIASEIVDIYPNPIKEKQIEVSYKYLNTLIGVEIPKTKVKEILAALEMEIVSENDEHFTVAVPTNKADVTRPADIVEEVLRIYGLNEVPIPSKINSSIALSQSPDPQSIKNTIADLLSSNGFHEIQGLSLTENRYFKDVLPIDDSELVYINNTSNIHLDVMRPTMLFSGLESVLRNQNRQNTDLKIYEFGKSYRKKKEGGFNETKHLTLFMTGERFGESWLNTQKTQVGYYTLKSFVANILTRLGLSGYQESAIHTDILNFGLKYHRGPQNLVNFGKVNSKILKKMDIKNTVFYAEFNWDTILKALKKHKTDFEALNKFPTVRRDLALVIDNSVKFADIVAIARKAGKKLLRDINLFDVYDDENKLGKGKKSYAVSYIFEDTTKTLKDKDVEKIMNNLIREYEGKLGAIIRR